MGAGAPPTLNTPCVALSPASFKKKKSKLIRQDEALSLSVCVCVCVCASELGERKRDLSERMVEWLRRVVNVKVALELMQIKKRWLIQFDPPPLPPVPPFTPLMRPFAWRY